ncbi:hypothetical protein RYX36_025254 [Vicia faba]
MATSSSKRDSSSSSSRWHNFSTRISMYLASASLEWLLILFLFISAIFSYVITKFASYCKLKAPCLFCSRIDHVLGFCETCILFANANPESSKLLVEDKCQKIEISVVCPSPSEATPFNVVPTLSSKIGVPVEVSKENDDFRTDEEGLMSKQGPTVDSEENINSGNKLIASEGGLESTRVSSDIGQQNLNSLDLGDAYKLPVGNRGRQLSGMLAEYWLGKESSRVN